MTMFVLVSVFTMLFSMLSAEMDLEEVSRKVRSGQYILEPHTSDSKSKKAFSSCWKTFRDVIDSSDASKVFGIACCSICYSCIVYKKKDGAKVADYGTKNLVDHADRCGTPDSSGKKQSTLINIVRRAAKPTLPKSVRDKVRTSEAQFIGGCQLAFNVVESQHFKQFCQCL